MLLAYVKPGSHFIVREAPEHRGVLLKANDCRCLVRWDKPPEYVHYTTSTGREVEFYRAAEPVSVTPYLDVEIA